MEAAGNDRISHEVWRGRNFYGKPITNINKALLDKSKKQYCGNCLLAIYVNIPVTTFEKAYELLEGIDIAPNSFKGIFIFFNSYVVEIKAGHLLSGPLGF